MLFDARAKFFFSVGRVSLAVSLLECQNLRLIPGNNDWLQSSGHILVLVRGDIHLSVLYPIVLVH